VIMPDGRLYTFGSYHEYLDGYLDQLMEQGHLTEREVALLQDRFGLR